MNEKIPILDHGYLQLIESWGSDERIIEAARQSVGGEFVSWEPYEKHPHGDFGLLKHLYKPKRGKSNTGPFEFAGVTIEAHAPVCVVWQWVRHRTQSYAIMSSRYIDIKCLDYAPLPERCLRDPGVNRQAGPLTGSERLTPEKASQWLANLSELYNHSQKVYADGLQAGIPKELARLALTFGRYFTFRATANLHNWLRFLSLRMDETEPQEEIRRYAQVVGSLISGLFPRTWLLFTENKKE